MATAPPYSYDNTDQVTQVDTGTTSGGVAVAGTGYRYDSAGEIVRQIKNANGDKRRFRHHRLLLRRSQRADGGVHGKHVSRVPVQVRRLLHLRPQREPAHQVVQQLLGHILDTELHVQLSRRADAGGGDPNGTYTFGYDADGNTTSLALNGSTQWNYAYDEEGRLCTVGNPSLSNPSAAYTYNANGSRTTVANGSGSYTERNDGVDATLAPAVGRPGAAHAGDV